MMPPRPLRILVLSAEHGFASEILAGIPLGAPAGEAWHCTLFQPGQSALATARRERPNGIICRSPCREFALAIAGLGIPAVEASMVVADCPLPRVAQDDRAIGRMAVDHLVAAGANALLMLDDGETAYGLERLRGFLDAIPAGHRYHHLRVPRRQAARSTPGQVHARRLLRTLESHAAPVGVFAVHDCLALWLTDALQLEGVAVPDRVLLLGVDDRPDLCELPWPRLSSIRLDGTGIGRVAAERLAALMAGRDERGDVLLPPVGVTRRGSTLPPVCEDPLVSEACRRLVGLPLRSGSIEAVARALGLSRRGLERRFASAIGVGPGRMHRCLLEANDASCRK